MAEYRPKNRGLERVLGTGALFSTAYGNVGSSIYYALGLVAVLALGMTPVVFAIAGVIFIFTAFTYTEATTMYPEAGGSSSFARQAFNEFWSALTAWGQMLNYIITVAISAFFLPHYLGILWEPLLTSPADILVGVGIVVFLACVNVVGVKEAANLNIVLAIADFVTQVALVALGIVLVLSPETLVENVDFGTSPTLADFLVAIPVGMVAFTGIDTISNMAEEARDYGKTIPQAMRAVVVAVMTISLTLPAVALSAMPVENGTTDLAEPSDEGGYADNPILGVVEQHGAGHLPGCGRALRRAARSDDPARSHQRGPDRPLAAQLFDGAVPPASRGGARSSIPGLERRTWRSCCSAAWRASRCCPARPSSSERSTRSARC